MVLTDFTEKATHAAKYAFDLARSIKADLLLFNAYIVPMSTGVDGGMYQLYPGDIKPFRDESTKRLEELSAQLKSQKISSTTPLPEISITNEMGSVADTIEKVIEEHGVNLVIMGDESRRSFFDRVFFRNDSARIIEKSTCPVLILTNETIFNPYKSVSLACGKMDFVHLKAIDFIADLTCQFETEIAIVHISNAENTESSAIHEKEYKQSVASYKLLIDYKNITWHTLIGKDVADILDKFSCFTDADITCIIHQRHPFYQSLFYNSITRQLIGDHGKPILIFPPTFQEGKGSGVDEQAYAKKYSTYEKS